MNYVISKDVRVTCTNYADSVGLTYKSLSNYLDCFPTTTANGSWLKYMLIDTIRSLLLKNKC